jgi:hypothetical protein
MADNTRQPRMNWNSKRVHLLLLCAIGLLINFLCLRKEH